MSPKRPTFLLAELPGALYEHMLLTMDGSSSSKFRAMFTLECTAKACRIPSSVWRDVVLACLKEIKDVDWERLLLIKTSHVRAYKQLARSHDETPMLCHAYDIANCIMADDLSELLKILRDVPRALAAKKWYEADEHFLPTTRVSDECFFVIYDGAVAKWFGAISERRAGKPSWMTSRCAAKPSWMISRPQTDPICLVDLVEFVDAISKGAKSIPNSIPTNWSWSIVSHFHYSLQ